MNDDFSPPRNFPLLGGIFEGSLVLVAVGLGWLLGIDPLQTFAFTPVDVVWGTLATLPLLAVLGLCLRFPVGPWAGLIRVVDQILVPLFRKCSVAEMAVISALAGLGEELLFRGLIQQALGDWVPGRFGIWVGLLGASLLFGLAHRITAAYAVLAGLIGLYLGGLWLLIGNLLVPITAHAVYDLIVMVYIVRIRATEAPSG